MDVPTTRDWFGLAEFDPGPRFTRGGARCYLLEEVGSTSDFLLGRGDLAVGRYCQWNGWGWDAQSLTRLSPITVPAIGTLVVARNQVGGRGRHGRQWTDCGGLAMSCVVPAHWAISELGFSVWAGLMVVLVLREQFNVDARLKWPNDIIARGRKLGGLLIDSLGTGVSASIVAGLGLNLDSGPAEFPSGLQGRATSLKIETGLSIRPATLTAAVLRRVDSQVDSFGAEGWAPFQNELACCDCLLGREVTLEAGGRRVTGRAVGIDDRGALVIDDGLSGKIAFRAGEVTHARTVDDNSQEGESRADRSG